jgi:glycosyl hydrolase family 38
MNWEGHMTASALVRPTAWEHDEMRAALQSTAAVYTEQVSNYRLAVMPEPLLRQDPELGLLQSVRITADRPDFAISGLTVIHVIGPSGTSIRCRVEPGPCKQSLRVLVPAVDQPRLLTFSFPDVAPGHQFRMEVTPQRQWTIHLVHHTHLDIGYTDPQNVVLSEHVAFLDACMDLTAATDGWPPDARFRWCVEALWSFDQWRHARPPERVAQFIDRVREGRIELTAMPFNLHTETCSTDELHELLRPAMGVRNRYGVEIPVAMQTDVPGSVVGLADALASHGVRYLSVAHNWAGRSVPHLVGGASLPRLFRWNSPAGKPLLVWLTDSSTGMAYMEGNVLGFSHDYGQVDTAFPAYLASLARTAYPYGEVSWGYHSKSIDSSRTPYPWDILHLRVQGQFSDNAPPNLVLSEIVKRWNETWAWPRMRISRNEDFFREAESRYREQIASFSGDWTDWWADGIGSGAHPQAIVRRAQARVRDGLTVGALAALIGTPGSPAVVPEAKGAYQHISLFNEHTWGAGNPATDGDSGDTSGEMQWHWKFAQALAAEAESATVLDQGRVSLSGELGAGEGALCSAYIVNPCSWERTDRVRVFIPSNRIPLDVPVSVVDARSGKQLEIDVEVEDKRSRINGRAIWLVVSDVPTCGLVRLDVFRAETELKSESGAIVRQKPESSFQLENEHLIVRVDPARSSICSIIERRTGQELVNQDNPLGLNGYIYDSYIGGGANHASGKVMADGATLDLLGERTAAGPAALVERVTEAAAERLTFEYRAAGSRAARTTLTLPRGIARLDIENRISKAQTLDKESAYFAFPFNLTTPTVRYELTGGAGGTGLPVVPGSARHARAIRRWVSFEEDDRTITWVTQDAPLIELSAVVLPYAPYPTTSPTEEPGTVYSWVHNNIWDTNFPLGQGFDTCFRYSVAVGDGHGPVLGMRTAAALAHPLTAVLSDPMAASVRDEWSLLQVSDDRVRVLGLTTPAQGELLIRLQSFAEDRVDLRVSFNLPVREAWEASYLADKLEQLPATGNGVTVPIAPLGTSAVLVRWNPQR